MTTAALQSPREAQAVHQLAAAPTGTPVQQALRTHPELDDVALMGTVGQNLKRLRKQHRLSLESLSALCGVSRAMLGQLEQGKSMPSIKTLWQVAQALGVSVIWFLESSQNVVHIPVPEESRFTLKAGEGELRPLQQMGDSGLDAFYELRLARGAEITLPVPLATHRVQVTAVQGVLTTLVDATAHTLLPREALQYEGAQPLVLRNDADIGVHAYVVVRAVTRQHAPHSHG
jgi:transcriptional regulator with XRE-family HTH domain